MTEDRRKTEYCNVYSQQCEEKFQKIQQLLTDHTIDLKLVINKIDALHTRKNEEHIEFKKILLMHDTIINGNGQKGLKTRIDATEKSLNDLSFWKEKVESGSQKIVFAVIIALAPSAFYAIHQIMVHVFGMKL